MGAAKIEITRKSLLKKQPKPIPKLYRIAIRYSKRVRNSRVLSVQR